MFGTDDVLLYFLNKISDQRCRRLIDDYLNRNILTVAYDTQDLKFQDKLVDKGKEKLVAEIRQLAKLEKNTTVLIATVTEKKAAKPPLSEETLRKVSFYNIENGTMEKIDDQLIATLAPKKTYRVYTTHDSEIKNKVRQTVTAILN